MKQINGYDEAEEYGLGGSAKKLPAGPYKMVITNVIDVPDREYLEVYADITEGEFKGYFADLAKAVGFDRSRSFRSYKPSALGFFKSFITSIEKSNPGYSWNWDEHSLIGKAVVGVFQEEEYVSKDGERKVGIKLDEFRSLQALAEGKIAVPPLKKLSPEDEARLAPTASDDAPKAASIDPLIGDDLPF